MAGLLHRGLSLPPAKENNGIIISGPLTSLQPRTLQIGSKVGNPEVIDLDISRGVCSDIQGKSPRAQGRKSLGLEEEGK